jgi:hypothetical protein
MTFTKIFTTMGLILASGQMTQAQTTNSGLFVEPAVTLELGTTSVDYPSPFSNSTGVSDGFGLGGKVGFHISEAFFVALDGRFSMPNFKDSSVNYDAKAIATNWGPVVGMQMPNLGLRIWGTLVLGGELNPEQSGSLDVRFAKASGLRIGTGFRISALSLNLEYQQLKYGESNLEQIGPFSSSSSFNNVTLENKSWIASVSFPLEL